MAILILVSIILQSTVCQMISIASIKPNLLIILTVSFGLMRGKKSGMLTGFFCGLLTDIFFNSIIGFNALIYLWVGYFSGYFYRIFYDDDIKTPTVSDLHFRSDIRDCAVWLYVSDERENSFFPLPRACDFAGGALHIDTDHCTLPASLPDQPEAEYD